MLYLKLRAWSLSHQFLFVFIIRLSTKLAKASAILYFIKALSSIQIVAIVCLLSIGYRINASYSVDTV